jgi:anti-sigma factor RsiW
VTCHELADFIDEYLANELPDEVRTQFEHHLRLCPNCRRYLAGYKTAVRLGKRAFDSGDAVPPTVPEELIAAILFARRLH